jgi:hypothetical protein
MAGDTTLPLELREVGVNSTLRFARSSFVVADVVHVGRDCSEAFSICAMSVWSVNFLLVMRGVWPRTPIGAVEQIGRA